MDITLPELENAINYWRMQRPAAGEEGTLSPEVDALATVYAQMIFHHMAKVPAERLDESVQRLMQAARDARTA